MDTYGEPGEENDITVVFASVEPGASENAMADIVWSESTGFSPVATVTIDPALTGGQLRAAVGHEGQHVLDAQAFTRSFTLAGDFDASKNLTISPDRHDRLPHYTKNSDI